MCILCKRPPLWNASQLGIALWLVLRVSSPFHKYIFIVVWNSFLAALRNGGYVGSSLLAG